MATARPFVMALLLAWALATAAATAREQTATPPALAIVVNRSNPIENLTFSELRHIFMLDTQTWPHGRKITVVLRDKGSRSGPTRSA